MKNSALREMVKALVAEFSTEGTMLFKRPMRVLKNPRCLRKQGRTMECIAFVHLNDEGHLVMFGDGEMVYFSQLSFTDRLRVLRYCTRFAEKAIREEEEDLQMLARERNELGATSEPQEEPQETPQDAPDDGNEDEGIDFIVGDFLDYLGSIFT